MDAIEKGMLAALNVENCQLCPLIAKIEAVDHDTLDFVWLEESYTRGWKIAKKKEGRNLIDWTDTIPKSSLILFDFQLTKSNRLQKATVEHLKAYDKLHD